MADSNQYNWQCGLLANEIEEFIEFKRKSGSEYISSELALKAFNRFCATLENQTLTPQQLADAWVDPDNKMTKRAGRCCVRQLGQYLTEQSHPKAFTILSDGGNAPRALGIKPSIFAREIKEFIDHKRSTGRKYGIEEYSLKSFDRFCAMKKNDTLTPQQLVDSWVKKTKEKSGSNIGMVREFGIYLTEQGSEKSFVVPYANGDIPKPVFSGYTSLFAGEIELFLKTKRSEGLKYKHEEIRLKDFDRFCNEHPDWPAQQLAKTFILYQDDCSYYKGKKSATVIKAFGNYLTENSCPNAYAIVDENFIVGPYAEEIDTFIDFKKSCGFKYQIAKYYLRVFDIFCASKVNESLAPQQLADAWTLQRDSEHPNTHAGRVDPVRVFGNYLASIGHPKAFTIATEIAKRKASKPPYLFTGDDINIFFEACAELEPNEKDPSMHIVLPAAFMFMHCMGIRTGELNISMENVNFETGEVIIIDAKTGDRVVYMSDELSASLLEYNLAIEKFFPCRKYLFPASVSRPRNDFAKQFSEIWTANVPDIGHGAPRLYDFRHHLLYKNVELCLLDGGDVNVLQPYVMRHMGHKLPESFQYYFHLSPPIQRELSKIKNNLDWMIPDVPEVPYE